MVDPYLCFRLRDLDLVVIHEFYDLCNYDCLNLEEKKTFVWLASMEEIASMAVLGDHFYYDEFLVYDEH